MSRRDPNRPDWWNWRADLPRPGRVESCFIALALAVALALLLLVLFGVLPALVVLS